MSQNLNPVKDMVDTMSKKQLRILVLCLISGMDVEKAVELAITLG